MMKIGNVELENNVILAPMAGVTDKAFRIICKEMGVSLSVTEMVSAKALLYEDKKTREFLDLSDETGKVAIQIFGSDIEAIEYAAKLISNETSASILDINMGCPVPKIVKNGEGSKLLQDLDLVGKIVNTAVKNSKIPVTVKIRTGWDKEHIVAVEAAKVIEDNGASMIAVHGRTRSEFYTGKADWSIIKKVKESVLIPVVGNGDIDSLDTAKKRIDETGVDGVMIARAALGNPWIFNGRKPDKSELLEIMLKHLELELKYKGEYAGIREMRPHLCAYIKGLSKASEMRQNINKIENAEELKKYLKENIR